MIKQTVSKFFFVVILFSLTQWMLPAQESDENENQENTINSVCIFLHVDISETESEVDFQKIISEVLNAELENAGYEIISSEKWMKIQKEKGLSDRELIMGPNAVSIAGELGATIAITGFYQVEGKNLVIEIKVYNVAEKRLVSGVIKSGRIGLNISNIINDAVVRMLPEIQETRETLLFEEGVEAEEFVIDELLLISPDEGMEVYLAGSYLIGVIKESNLRISDIPFKVGTEISIEKRKEGYHSDWEVIKLDNRNQEVELKPLRKKTKLSSYFTWSTGQWLGMGLGMRYYFLPDRTYLAGEDYFYIQHNFREGSNPLYHNDFRLLFGQYIIWKPNSVFRFNLSFGIGFILTFWSQPDTPFNLDFYINIANPTIELNFLKFTIFYRAEIKYSLGNKRGLLLRGIQKVGDHYGPPMTIGVMIKW